MSLPKRGRRLKLNPELIDRCCEILKATGSDRLAYEGAGISAETFYRYLREIPSFAEAIAQARSERSQEIEATVWDRKAAAEEWIDKVLKGQAFKTIHQETLTQKGEIVTLIRREQVIPSERLLERLTGTSDAEPPTFKLSIDLAEPSDLDESDA